MKKSGLICLICVCLLLSMLTSCYADPQEVPQLYLESMSVNSTDDEGTEHSIIRDPFNYRNVEISFPGNSEIVLVIEGVEYKGTYSYFMDSPWENGKTETKASQDDPYYGCSHYVFTMTDGSEGEFYLGLFGFDGVWYDCTVIYKGITCVFGDRERFSGIDYSMSYEEWNEYYTNAFVN